MANKYRKKQVRAPYRKFQGGDGPPDEVGELVYLGYTKKKLAQQLGSFQTPAIPLKLPLELLNMVVGFCNGQDAYNLLFTSKMWHAAALPKLYQAPELNARNFPQFVQLVNRRKDLSAFVKDLDLSRTIQTGKNSWNAKLLCSCSETLLRFVAPQTNFGFSPMMALRSCTHLRILDLAYASDTVELPQLLAAITQFRDLEVVRFPRNTTVAETIGDFEWPQRLRSLSLAGNVPDSIVANLPPHLMNLELQNCPQITDAAIFTALVQVGPNLSSLAVHHPMPLLSPECLDNALIMCPHIVSLGLSIEYFSSEIFDEDAATDHPLSRFSVHASSSLGVTSKLKPEDIYIATEYMTELAQVRLSVVLGWTSVTEEVINDLAEVLDERGGGLYIA